jgi:hypothetical protein
MSIHIKYGVEFRRDLYQSNDRAPWLEAVGQELQDRGVSLRLGEGSSAFQVRNAGDLKRFYDKYESNPEQVAREIGLEPGQDLQRYVADLVQALDDIVKDTSGVKRGDTVDLRTGGDLSKLLGLEDAGRRYASSRTEFGKTAPAEGTMNVLGVMLSRHADPLAGQMYIDPTTFEGKSFKSDRNSLEFEAVRRLGGLDKGEMLELLRKEVNGRPVLRRMRKAKDAEAFSIGYDGISLDEMRWDSRAHSIREKSPFVSLTVESGRLEKDEDDGEYEVGLGTDYNEDAYYDTDNFTLLNNDMSVRGRIRRDDAVPGADGVRRVLVQSKIGSSVDENGMKFAAKADIRKDGPSAEDIAGLDEDVRTGTSGWGWGANNEQPIEAIGLVFNELKERGQLDEIGGRKDVLQLKPKAHVRSTRSRFHYNETERNDSVRFFQKTGEPNIREALEFLGASENIDANDKAALQSLGEGILDRSVFVEACAEKLAAIDPNLSVADVNADTINALWPDKSVTSSKMETQKRKVVSEAIKTAFDDFAVKLDDSRRDIANSGGRENRPFRLTEDVIEFMKSKDAGSRSTMTVKPFMERFDKELAGPNRDAFVEELAVWLKDEKGESALFDAADKDKALGSIRGDMVSEHLEIMHRQIEASGSMGKNLWFDSARKAYAGNERQWGNFLIDTFDVSEFYTPEAWDKLSPEEKAGAEDIDPSKMYHAEIINEVQIELRYEKPFVEAKDKARSALQGAQAGLMMDFTLANGMDVVADKPETFGNWLTEFKSQPQDQQQEVLQQLNAFAEDRGSAVRFSAEELSELPQSLMTTGRQGQDTAGHSQLVEDMEMTTFIWDELSGMQERMADLRGRRVRREAERAGYDGVSWEVSDLSKGDRALTLIQDPQ